LAVRFTVAVPKKLSAEQRRLIEELSTHDPATETLAAGHDGAQSSGFFFGRKKKKRGG
jgi:hypothetical protein